MLHRLDVAIDSEQWLGIVEPHRPDGQPGCGDRKTTRHHDSLRLLIYGAIGWNERISSVPGRTTPAEASGTAFQAPGRSPSGSETTNRVSSPRLCKISTSGCSWRSVATLVEKYSDRLLPSLEYRKAQMDSPSLVATVPW